MPEPSLTHLERRKIEAGVLVPLIQAFQRAVGEEKTHAVVREVVLELARADGERWAKSFGNDLDAMEQVRGVWAGGGSLEIQPLEKTGKTLHFNVTRCRYAEFYQELGLPQLGYLLHCNRDFAMVEGFSDQLKLKRTQTVMEGKTHCDFRFSRENEA